MEIFLFAPYGLGAKFEFSLYAQPRTEKLPRGTKSNAFLKQIHRFWGQALQKRDCGFQKGKALCLHRKPIFILFHNFRSIPVLIVPRSGTQKIIKKYKEAYNYIENGIVGFFQRCALSCRAHLTPPQSALCVNASEVVKKFLYRSRVQMTGFA